MSGRSIILQNKRQIQKEATREKIIKTAIRVYAENGFNTPTSVIAKESGVSHGTIFAHFPTLNDLLLCLIQTFYDDIGIKLHNLSKSGNNIAGLLQMHLNVLEEYEGFYKRLISETSSLPDEIKNTLIGIQSTVSKHFSIVIEQGINKGSIKNIPVHILFNTWLGLVHYYLQNSDLFAPNTSVLKQYKNELINNFLELIAK